MADRPRIAVVLEGGLVSGIVTDDPRFEDIEFMVIDSVSYLFVANVANSAAPSPINSELLRWDPLLQRFVNHQYIPTNGSSKAKFFTIGSDSYLAVTNAYGSITNTTNSAVYKWCGSRFAV